jgi:mono/diheme cytochrome c family protein
MFAMRAAAFALLSCAGAVRLLAGDANELFETRVRPVLANNCFACHTTSRLGGLQLDSREHILKGGNSGPAIVPGDADQSLLIQAIRQTHARLKMPPTGKLPQNDIDSLAAWINAGAPWPTSAQPSASAGAPKSSEYVIRPEQRAFWSFQPVRRPPTPPVKNMKWARTDIDRFILAKLEQRGLEPVAPADKRVLLRRATFDLIGLPPTPAETDAFLADRSPRAFEKVIDRLLASPHYGERWGRFWLDVARYSDDRLNSERDDPYPNAFRYRDWVIQAFNEDMPYNKFVQSQIAGDLMPDPARHAAGLGFYSLSPEMQDDRVDATTRGFLGLTVACAQCHDHKYDPIPTKDYYSLLGIFNNTELHETPLASDDIVSAWNARKKQIDEQSKAITDFVARQSQDLSEILAAQSARYIVAAASDSHDASLDAETLARWVKYLNGTKRDHPFLREFDEARAKHADVTPIAAKLQELILAINEEKKQVDDRNHITLGQNPDRKALSQANLASLERDRFTFWEELFGERGVLHYGDAKGDRKADGKGDGKSDGKIDRFLAPQWKSHLDELRARLKELEKEQPQKYAFLHTIRNVDKPETQHVWIRGDANNPGDVVEPHFLTILSASAPKPFAKGRERLDLAAAITDPGNPLTARVIVNRVWAHHFGQGLVRTPSNFGLMGDRPSNPELLDYLAARFVSEGWSFKKLHREIMLSSVYALSTQNSPKAEAADPENRMLWRANRRRLDAEGLRDELLYVSGNIDLQPGGAPERFTAENRRRTVYGFVSRRKIDAVLGLFDFPNPNSTSEQRLDTNVPLQRLFFMNSGFMLDESRALAGRLAQTPGDDAQRITAAYRLCFQREPTTEEKRLGLEFLQAGKDAWPAYTQVLLSSNEFAFLN